MSSVWYHAEYNEIWIRVKRNHIERGCQALIKTPGYDFSVPDYLGLFDWKIDLKKWKREIKYGFLIKLGQL